MKVLVSYWITARENTPQDILLCLNECTLNMQAIEEIKSKIADKRLFGSPRSFYHAYKSEVIILGIIKLDE